MYDTEDAVWRLYGEAIVLFAVRKRRMLALPNGLSRMTGPTMILAERYDTSPVGPFISLSVAEPARIGLRPGYFFGVVGVNSAHVKRANCAYWGLPATLGAITWENSGETTSVRWPERNFELTVVSTQSPLPFLLPSRSIQMRQDGPVLITSRIRSSMARPCTADTHFADVDDECNVLNGRHRGFLLSGTTVRRGPARHPVGLLSTFRAPLRAPEPGILGAGRQ